MSPTEAYKEHLEYWQKAKQKYLAEIASYERKMQETSPTRRQCYEGLKRLREEQVNECDKQILRLLTHKRESSHKEFEESGKVIAKWQKSKGKEGLSYKEWKKKYGDRFTKV